MRSSFRSTLVLFALTSAALVACSGDEQDPKETLSTVTVTISSPAANTTLREDAKFTLTATATDPVDGDVSSRLTWTSSRDGALTPDAEHQVRLSAGAHTLTASATDAKGRVASATVAVTATAMPAATHVVSEGRRLHMYAFNGDEVLEYAVAEIPAEGTLANHSIFNVAQHPTKPWLYTLSFNDCAGGTCWGNARIDRFVISGRTLTHAGVAFSYKTADTTLPCALETGDDGSRQDSCAPVGITFNADGSRLLIQDDEEDALQVFSVDATTGAVNYLAETDQNAAYLHGVALHPSAPYVYNGSSTFHFENDTFTETPASSGNGGNATQIVTLGTGLGLLSTWDTDALAIYDLANPAAPTEVSSLTLGSNKARDVAHNAALTQLVTVGKNSVSTVGFDGAALTLQRTLTLTDNPATENRAVVLTANGTRALVGWFKYLDAVRSGGLTQYSVSATGELAAVGTILYAEPVRVVYAVRAQ